MNKHLSQKHLLLLVTCVTAICIAFMGMRVPDLSRPHRPKPTHRAFVEKQFKNPQQEVRKFVDGGFALPVTHVEPRAVPEYGRLFLSVFSYTGFPRLFPNLSRAPPA